MVVSRNAFGGEERVSGYHRILSAGVGLAALAMGARPALAADGLDTTSSGTTTVTSGQTIDSTSGFGLANQVGGSGLTLINDGTIRVRNQSGANAIENYGTITSLTNNGTILGTGIANNKAIENYGTITTLINNGAITSTTIWGIFNTGTITTLFNTGTITGGSSYGIRNLGNIGTLTNGQSGLTYAGVLPGTYNTHFNSSSSFGTVSFTNGGSTLTYGLSKADTVSYMLGTYRDVIKSDTSLTHLTYLTVNGVTYSLSLADSCSGNSYCYDLNITAISAASAASGGWTAKGAMAGGAGGAVGAALDVIANNNGLSSQLSSLEALSASAQSHGIKQLGVSTLTPLALSSGATIRPSNASIDDHLNAVLADGSGNKGVSAGNAFQQGALWGQVLGNHSSLESSSQGDGFASNAFGVMMGADTFVSDTALTGVAFNWLRNMAEGKSDSSGNSTTTDTFQLSLYGSWRPTGQAAWVQGLVAGGVNQYRQKRDIDYLGQTASAKYQGLQAQAKITSGYDFALNDGATVSPLGSLQVMRVQNQAYSETGSSVNQSSDRQGFNNVESVIGAKVAQRFDSDVGQVTVDAQAGWLHDYLHSPITTTANLAGVGYVVNTARLPSNGAQLSFGTSWQQSDDLSLRLEYQGDLRSGYASHTGLLKLRETF